MAWASTPKVILGCVAFVIWWMLAVFPAVPFLPVGRTAGSLLGATLMVVFQVISPNDAFAAVDLPILGLLFGTMVISVYLERAGLFDYLGFALSWRTRGGKDFLCRLCLLAALSSALFTNDTTCVVLTSFVLKLCKEKKLRPEPFLIALACSSNIGSSATPIGNPQNLVIAVSSHISFGSFLAGVFPAMAVGLVVNTLLLLAAYGRHLSLPPGDSAPQQPGVRNSENSRREAGHTEVELRGISSDSNGGASGHSVSPQKSPSRQHSLELNGPRGDSLVVPGDAHISKVGDERWEDSRERGGPGRSAGEIIIFLSDRDQSAAHSAQSLESARQASSRAVSRDDLEASRDVATMDQRRGFSKVCVVVVSTVCGKRGAAWLRRGWRRYQQRIWKASVCLVTLGMLAALLAGLSLPWSAITAAVVLMVLDFSDAGPSLDKVSPPPLSLHFPSGCSIILTVKVNELK